MNHVAIDLASLYVDRLFAVNAGGADIREASSVNEILDMLPQTIRLELHHPAGLVFRRIRPNARSIRDRQDLVFTQTRRMTKTIAAPDFEKLGRKHLRLQAAYTYLGGRVELEVDRPSCKQRVIRMCQQLPAIGKSSGCEGNTQQEEKKNMRETHRRLSENERLVEYSMKSEEVIPQVEWYAAARTSMDVLVDLDVGDYRTGAATIDQALEIARAVDRSPDLTLRGIQAYSVRGSHGGDRAERRQISEAAFATAAEARDAFLRNGLCADIVSGGSTGTWDIDLALPVVTELQAGSYVLMDLAYRRLGLDFANFCAFWLP
jgi:hypothetical protein